MSAVARENPRLILTVLSVGVLMIVIESTIVNVALSLIVADFHISEATAAWVVNAYMLAFGGMLLLAGRLGDLFGHRPLYLAGIAVFSIGSLACGLATTPELLIAFRALQGIGGAASLAVALSLIIEKFPEQKSRAKAVSVYSAVCAAGGSTGLLFGGVLSGTLGWRSIFLINVPIGLAVLLLGRKFLPRMQRYVSVKNLDIWGAVTITLSMTLINFAITDIGIVSVTWPLALGAAGVMFLMAFILVERRALLPIVPLRLLRIRSLVVATAIGALWAAGLYAWFFLAARFMRLILNFEPLQMGFVFTPTNAVMALFALGLSARIVCRLGTGVPLVAGLLLAASGIAWLARVPVDPDILKDLLPSMFLVGLGGGLAFNPLLLLAMRDVPAEYTGLAYGVINTSFMMGGAVGIATCSSLAAMRAEGIRTSGSSISVALTDGYHIAFLLGFMCVGIAMLLSISFLRRRSLPVMDQSAANLQSERVL